MDVLNIIMSGALADQEIIAEYGALPPSFLPVGNKRLYEYQLSLFSGRGTTYIVVPKNYDVPELDRIRLRELSAHLIAIDEGMSLGEAVTYAISSVGFNDSRIRILHGDTLLSAPDLNKFNSCAISDWSDGHAWAKVELEQGILKTIVATPPGGDRSGSAPTAVGYFSFESSVSLVLAITRAHGDFIKGINIYAQHFSCSAMQTPDWHDFGHLHSFYRSRRAVVTARSFNSLENDGTAVRKSSQDYQKIESEAHWLTSVPPPISLSTARIIDAGKSSGRSFYRTEYVYAPSLAELFCFSLLDKSTWNVIFQACGEFLASCASMKRSGSARTILDVLGPAKTISRLNEFAQQSNFDIEAQNYFNGAPAPSLKSIAEQLAARINASDDSPETIMHGDFCFSNILFDFRTRRVRVIDPRGYIESGHATIFGDFRYDMAKLAHSIRGRYDQIVAGRYTLTGVGHNFDLTFEPLEHQVWLEDWFNHLEIEGVIGSGILVRALTASLFLSMLPLHADRPDRQRAFVANALRLYRELDGADL